MLVWLESAFSSSSALEIYLHWHNLHIEDTVLPCTHHICMHSENSQVQNIQRSKTGTSMSSLHLRFVRTKTGLITSASCLLMKGRKGQEYFHITQCPVKTVKYMFNDNVKYMFNAHKNNSRSKATEFVLNTRI